MYEYVPADVDVGDACLGVPFKNSFFVLYFLDKLDLALSGCCPWLPLAACSGVGNG